MLSVKNCIAAFSQYVFIIVAIQIYTATLEKHSDC